MPSMSESVVGFCSLTYPWEAYLLPWGSCLQPPDNSRSQRSQRMRQEEHFTTMAGSKPTYVALEAAEHWVFAPESPRAMWVGEPHLS